MPGARIAVVVASWNSEITSRLADAAVERGRAAGATVERFDVAGSFELPAAVALLGDTARYDAIVPLGCLIRGETPHFDVLARAVAEGLMQLSLAYPIAIPFGVLTCDTPAQARARSGGRKGNAGAAAMDAAMGMIALRRSVGAGAAARPGGRASRAAPRARRPRRYP